MSAFDAPLSHTERMVVAPATGQFEPLTGAGGLRQGARIRIGQVVGHIRNAGTLTPVTSPFEGSARQTMAWADERVRQYQPILWMSRLA